MYDSLRPQGLYSPWNSPGQNTGMGSFPFSRGSNPGLLHFRWILYQLSHQRSPEKGTDELICKVEIETHLENKYMDTKRGRKGGMNWESGIDIYTLICIKYITDENLTYSTGNSTQCSVVTSMGRRRYQKKRRDMYTYG